MYLVSFFSTIFPSFFLINAYKHTTRFSGVAPSDYPKSVFFSSISYSHLCLSSINFAPFFSFWDSSVYHKIALFITGSTFEAVTIF